MCYNEFFDFNDRTTIDTNQDQNEIDLDSVSLLIPKSRKGDRVAREQLLTELQSYLELIARQNLNDDLKRKIGTSDVVQMSFLRVVEHFDQFRGQSKGEFCNWVKTIVINEIRNTRRSYTAGKRDYRKEKQHDGSTDQKPFPMAVDTHLTPSSENMAAERLERFYDVLNELSPEHSQVINLRSIQELPFKEVAQKMNRSEDAVSKLWYRAMLKLEENLKRNGNFESQ